METRFIDLCTHQKNIDHYQGLLKTKLSKTERQYLEKRVCEEKIAILQFMEHQIKQRKFCLSSIPSRLHWPQASDQ